MKRGVQKYRRGRRRRGGEKKDQKIWDRSEKNKFNRGRQDHNEEDKTTKTKKEDKVEIKENILYRNN
jgi:hypothetical protein